MSSIIGKYLKITLVVWGISLIFSVPAFWFLLRPQMKKIEVYKHDYNELKNQAFTATLEAEESTMRALQKQFDEVKTKYGMFVVHSKDDIQNLASLEIYNMSREIGLDSFHIDPWSTREIAAFSDCKYVFGQPMKVTFNASFPEFAKFLNMLERYKLVIFVDTFSITRENPEDIKHKVEMNLAVLVEKPVAVKDIKS